MRRAALLLLLVACSTTTAEPVTTPTPTPIATPVPTGAPTVVARPVFAVGKILDMIEMLAEVGPREASSEEYDEAARLVAGRLRSFGYRVRTQTVPVRAGRVDGIEVPAGETTNVIAEPKGFRMAEPFAVVGAHLDTSPDSPGANDNASGVAVMIELARVAQKHPLPVPTVFVAFGGEERRRQSKTSSQIAIGARAYVDSLSAEARRNLEAAVVLDMVGAGSNVKLLGTPRMRAFALKRATDIDVPAREETTVYYSDHIAFTERRLPAVWLWAGNHRTLHTALDIPAVIQPAEILRITRLSWAILIALPSPD